MSFWGLRKYWGRTYRLPQPSGSEVHVAFIKKGGKSSLHLHEKHINGFFIVSGKLKIIQEIGPDQILEGDPSQERHDFVAIETGNEHSFEALDDTILVEVYGVVDIVRRKKVT